MITTESSTPAHRRGVAEQARPFLVARGLSLAFGLGSAVVTARFLGAEGRGQLALFMTIALGCGAILGMGAPIAGYDLVAQRRETAARALSLSVVVAGLAGLGSAALGLVGFSGDLLVAGALGVTVAASLISSSAGMVLLATSRGKAAALLQACLPVLAFGSYLVACVVLRGTWRDAVVAYALAAFLVAGAALTIVGPSRPAGGWLIWREFGSRGLRVAPGDIANFLSYRIDTFLLLSLAGVGPLGRYATAVQLVEPTWVAATALSAAVMATRQPRDAGDGTRHASADVGWGAEVSKAVRGAIVVATGGCVVVALGTWGVGSSLLGPEFERVPLIVVGLMLGTAALGASKVLAGAVIARGRIGVSSVVATTSVVTNVAANLVLIPSFGELGAALASSVSYTLSALLWTAAWRRSGGLLGWKDLVPRRGDLDLILDLVAPNRLLAATRTPRP